MNQAPRIRAVMLDWAGTTVDHGSVAPVLALKTLFAKHGIALSMEDARRDMGLLKRDHIQAILALTNVSSEWHALFGKKPGIEEVSQLFDEFGPLQMDIITQHSQLIEGVAETVTTWQNRGLLIGSTTGYTREMLSPVLAQAAASGYRPNASVCPDEVGAGRPAPWMLARNAQMLNVYPPSSCIKIGDTISDIEEGRNAGMWTIGLTRTGNMIGLDAPTFNQLPTTQKEILLKHAAHKLLEAGAHFVAEDLSACDQILAQIESKLEDGVFPARVAV
ncbi:MAG: phosphonoacetaldehyde hydrolase [Edaphobacter sp.]